MLLIIQRVVIMQCQKLKLVGGISFLLHSPFCYLFLSVMKNRNMNEKWKMTHFSVANMHACKGLMQSHNVL